VVWCNISRGWVVRSGLVTPSQGLLGGDHIKESAPNNIKVIHSGWLDFINPVTQLVACSSLCCIRHGRLVSGYGAVVGAPREIFPAAWGWADTGAPLDMGEHSRRGSCLNPAPSKIGWILAPWFVSGKLRYASSCCVPTLCLLVCLQLALHTPNSSVRFS
jgi:hypothetical protein